MITDVNSDQQQRGLQVNLTIDRDAASRLGISTRNISATLYDAFGQRQVSTIYNALNQYHVVMEVAPQWWESPESLKDIYVSTSGGAISGTQTTGSIASSTASSTSTGAAGTGAQTIDPAQAVRNQRTNQIAVSGRGSASTGAAVSTTPETMVPLSAVTRWDYGTTPLAVNHQSLFVASTVSFNLAPGKTLSDAVQYVNDTMARDRHAHDPARRLPGHGAGLPAVAQQPAPAGAGGAGGRLYRAGHSLRELHPSDHHPVDPAVGRHRRVAGAASSRAWSSASSP